MSWASWLLFTGVLAPCVVLRVWRPGPPGSCSPLCTLCVWRCVLGLLGLLAPAPRRARSVCAAAVRMRCPGPPGSCSTACTLSVCCCMCSVLGRLAPVHRCACFGAPCRVYGVLGPLAPVHRCARFVCGAVCASSWASWLLFTGARARCVLLACFLSPSLILACSCACSP